MKQNIPTLQSRYGKSFAFLLLLIVSGFIADYFSESKISLMPPAPYNIYILLSFVTLIIFLHLFYRKTKLITWVSSVPVAISSITAVLVLVLLMGFIPQSETTNGFISKLSLNDLKNSKVLALNAFFMLISLGLVTLKRLTPFNYKNAGFFLNHFGLWLVIAAAIFGSTDIVKLKLVSYEENNPEWRAESDNHVYELPIAIKLDDFDIEEYTSKLAVIDLEKGIVADEFENTITSADSGTVVNVSGWEIVVNDYLQQSVRFDNRYVEFFSKGACAAAYVTCTNNSDTVQGWISSGSYLHGSEFVELDNGYAIALLKPEPKRYYSNVKLFAKDGTVESKVIDVNKPAKFKGWTIYQLSYDDVKGRWSDYSVFELVKDPWLPVVYAGLFLILAGALYMFTLANRKRL